MASHSKNQYAKSSLGFPSGSVVKNLPANAKDVGSISGSGRSPAERSGNPLQYSCLVSPRDRGAGRLQSGDCKRVRHDLQLNNNKGQGARLEWKGCVNEDGKGGWKCRLKGENGRGHWCYAEKSGLFLRFIRGSVLFYFQPPRGMIGKIWKAFCIMYVSHQEILTIVNTEGFAIWD